MRVVNTLLMIVSLFGFLLKANKNNTPPTLQELIDQAYYRKEVLILKENQEYHINETLNIKCSIKGNGAKIIPNTSNTIAVSLDNNIIIENLEISSDKMKMIDIVGNNVTIDNCIIKTSQYFVLLRLSGNNLSITNSVLENNFNSNHQFILKNKENESINNLYIENCTLKGGVLLTNNDQNYVGNYKFINNKIEIDYSHAEQNFRTQHDAFRFAGIDGVEFTKNNITTKNVNRVFKTTDAIPFNENKKISTLPTKNVEIINNTISSESVNGKQFFDMFDGTSNVKILLNEIHSKGHTTLFEDKTTLLQNYPRKLIIKDNKIYFDFRLIYYRGGESLEKISNDVILEIENNEFFYTPKKYNRILKRTGSDFDVELQYPIYARSISKLICINNQFYGTNLDNPFNSTYTFFINEVESTLIKDNRFSGGVLLLPAKEGSLNFINNSISDIDMDEVITIKNKSSDYRNYKIKVDNNTIKSKRKIKISSNNVNSSNNKLLTK